MKKDCTTCKFANFERHKSGRRNLNKGSCEKVVVMPISYKSHYGDYPYSDYPSKRGVWKGFGSDGECKCWEA